MADDPPRADDTPGNQQDRARTLFDRIHRSPRIPDRYAERRASRAI